VTNLSAENDALNKEVDRVKHVGQLRSDTAASVKQASNNQNTQRVVSNNSNFSKPVVVCWSCGSAGHYARDCGQRQSNVYQNQPTAQFGVTPNYRVAGAFVNLDKTKHRATYLRANVDGQEQDCLLDTDSEVSVLPASLVRNELLRQTTQTLRAPNGTKIGVLGEATVSFHTPFFSLTVTGLVSDHVVEVMLGVDWLVKNNAT